MTLNGAPVAAHVMENSAPTPVGGVTAPLVSAPTDDSPVCEPTDYDGLSVAGAIVLVDRGTCYLADKVKVAASRGAVGVVIADNKDESVLLYGLPDDTDIKVPALWVTKADGAKLRTQTGTASLTVDAVQRDVKTRNVIAQTTTGSDLKTVMVGAHLDSVRSVRESTTTDQVWRPCWRPLCRWAARRRSQNAVRFGFWGAEEECLLGSRNYVRSLRCGQAREIALYLNFDMIGSPNPGYFAWTAICRTTGPRRGHADGPGRLRRYRPGVGRVSAKAQGSAGRLPFDGRSDYIRSPQPVCRWADWRQAPSEVKTAEQVALWGGEAGRPFDPNYHSAQ